MTNNPIGRKNDIVVQDMADEILIYDIQANKAYALNETASFVWRSLDGKANAADISRKLGNKLKTPVDENIVWLALEQFRMDGLLEDADSFSTPVTGLSRREVVKRVGFASMVALPTVASLLAPTAVSAQSVACGCIFNSNLRNNDGGCGCNSNNDCCSNVCGGGGTVCTAVAANPSGAASCCTTTVCPPANSTGNPAGCTCNGNANCLSGLCTNSICR
jgi:hypothetical protein